MELNKKTFLGLLFLFLFDIVFPMKFYKQNVAFSYKNETISQSYDFNIPDFFYKKEYLMQNLKYVEISDSIQTKQIPQNIRTLSKKWGAKNGNSDRLTAHWIALSNFGAYSYGNNPFGIEFVDAKKIINFPSTATIYTKKYKLIDSSYKKVFVKTCNFSSIDEAFEVFSKLPEPNDELYLEKVSEIEKKIRLEKKWKDTVDSKKMNIFGADTITRNDSNIVYKKEKNENYTPSVIINPLLLVFISLLFLKKKC